MFNEAFKAKNGDFRNGYYYRHLKTNYGMIEVKIPRDRLNLFKTQIMKPYRQVTDDVDYVVQSLYFKGLSQNDCLVYLVSPVSISLTESSTPDSLTRLLVQIVSCISFLKLHKKIIDRERKRESQAVFKMEC